MAFITLLLKQFPAILITLELVMNKSSLLLLVSICSLLIACSSAEKQQLSVVAKPSHKHRPLANGILSVDIIKHQGKLHLLKGTHYNDEKALWYQYSSNQGKDWSVAVNINNAKHIEANLSRGNDARLAVQGDNIVAIWPGRVEGAPHNAGPMKAVRSADGGKSWQKSAIPADWSTGPHAFFAMDGNDQAINVVWLDSRNDKSSVKGSQGLRFSQSKDGGQSWSSNKTLDNVTCACCWNTAKFDFNNEFFVLYRDKQPSDMAIGVLKDDNQWQRISTVGDFNWDFPGCPHIGGGLAFQQKDQTMHTVVGSGHMEHLGVHYLQSNDQGRNWSNPVQLGDESSVHADIASSDNGRVIAVWDMRTEDGLAVFYTESSNGGLSWSTNKRLSKPGMRATHPRIISHKSGFLTLWTESETGKIQNLQMQSL